MRMSLRPRNSSSDCESSRGKYLFPRRLNRILPHQHITRSQPIRQGEIIIWVCVIYWHIRFLRLLLLHLLLHQAWPPFFLQTVNFRTLIGRRHSHMTRATPEQIKIVRRRRKVWVATCIATGALWTVPVFIMEQFDKSPAVRTVMLYWIFMGLLFGYIFFLVFSLLYLRCPACKRALSRDSLGKNCCQKCHTSFAA